MYRYPYSSSRTAKGEEINDLKKIIIAYKAHRVTLLADKVWTEKAWTEDTMQQFLQTHMRTPYQK
jgi:hypothetical protein